MPDTPSRPRSNSAPPPETLVSDVSGPLEEPVAKEAPDIRVTSVVMVNPQPVVEQKQSEEEEEDHQNEEEKQTDVYRINKLDQLSKRVLKNVESLIANIKKFTQISASEKSAIFIEPTSRIVVTVGQMMSIVDEFEVYYFFFLFLFFLFSFSFFFFFLETNG